MISIVVHRAIFASTVVCVAVSVVSEDLSKDVKIEVVAVFVSLI